MMTWSRPSATNFASRFRVDRGTSGLGVYLIKAEGVTTGEEIALLDRIKEKLPGVLDQLGLSQADLELLRKNMKEDSPGVSLHSEEFPIVGVLRGREPDEELGGWDPLVPRAECLLPYGTALDMLSHIEAKDGIGMAVVIVDDEEHVRAVNDRIKTTGLSTFSLLELIEREQLMYLLIFGGMTCVAAVALLVAALGIANTMLMSVLERTREIGIMKAIGATGGQLQLVFLIEGALIGLVGGALGIAAAWAASFAGDAWVQSLVAANFPDEVIGQLFVFPAWLVGTVVAMAALVTTVAALYPARRAARIDPVAALRHE